MAGQALQFTPCEVLPIPDEAAPDTEQQPLAPPDVADRDLAAWAAGYAEGFAEAKRAASIEARVRRLWSRSGAHSESS
jgi:hypothetical protein